MDMHAIYKCSACKAERSYGNASPDYGHAEVLILCVPCKGYKVHNYTGMSSIRSFHWNQFDELRGVKVPPPARTAPEVKLKN